MESKGFRGDVHDPGYKSTLPSQQLWLSGVVPAFLTSSEPVELLDEYTSCPHLCTFCRHWLLLLEALGVTKDGKLGGDSDPELGTVLQLNKEMQVALLMQQLCLPGEGTLPSQSPTCSQELLVHGAGW